MALTQRDRRTLQSAIGTIVRHCGGDSKYKDLVGHLKTVEGDLTTAAPAPGRDGPDDDYSFETAQKRHSERAETATTAQA
jgi:hypothetical protein